MRREIERRILLVLILAAAFSVSVCACGEQKGTRRAASEAEMLRSDSDGVLTIGFSQLGAESDWRVANTQSIENAFSDNNRYNLIFSNGRQIQDNQIKAIRNFIQQQVDYIIFSPLEEDGWDTVLEEANEQSVNRL